MDSRERENGPDTSMLILWGGEEFCRGFSKNYYLIVSFLVSFLNALRSLKIFNQDSCHPSNSDRRSSTNRNENFQSDRDSFK